MKKLLFIIGTLMLNAIVMKAQITYEHTYTITQPGQANVFVTNLGHNNYKHVIHDYYKGELNLFNLDHTPFMLNIPIPVHDSGAYYTLGYVTSTLFDCDSTTIEYALMGFQPDPTKKFLVYRTDGTLIFSRDSVTSNYCYGCGAGSIEIHPIVNTPDGAKLYLLKYLTGSWEISVYALCDSLPVSYMDMNQPNFYVKVFPNPSASQVNFKISAPNYYEQLELRIFNAEFKTIKTNIINGRTELNLDCRFLASGTYFYSLQNKNKVFQTGKFILSK